jgi:hypothetical protein
MAPIVYALCALTSLGCAALLLRGYRGNRLKLLLWSGLCFVALGVENIFLFVDNIVLPAVDLAILRNGIGMLGPALLLFALISEAE